MDLQHKSTGLRFPYTIPATLVSTNDLNFTQSGPLIGGSVAAFLLVVSLLAIIIVTVGKKSWNKEQTKGK
jgi:hypothetical protein